MRLTFWLILALIGASILIVVSCVSGDDDDDDSSADDDTADDTADDDADDDAGTHQTDPTAECEQITDEEPNQACIACVTQCNVALQAGVDLSSGPCLSNAIVTGWACDVVHIPRSPEDDLIENECAQHVAGFVRLVEVSTDCRFISEQ